MTKQETKEKQQKSVSIGDIIRISLAHWRWFVISFIVMMGLAFYKIKSSEPVYSRTATILVKEDMGNGAGSLASAFGNFGGFSATSDVNNELEALKSPAILLQVIENLKLNISYERLGFFRPSTLWGSNLPFIMSFPEDCEMGIELKGTLKPSGEMNISKIRTYYFEQKEKYSVDYNLNINAPDSIDTPFGKLYVMANPEFVQNPTEAPEEFKFCVRYTTPKGALNSVEGGLKISIPNMKASVISLTYDDHSPSRAVAVLNDLIHVYNQTWMDDKNLMIVATSQFVDDRLVSLERELREVDRQISNYQKDNVIPDLLTAVRTDITKQSAQEQAIVEAQIRLSIAKSVLEYVTDSSNNEKLLPALNLGEGRDQGINSQIEEYNKMLMERNRLSSSTTENNPLLVDYDKRLKSMRSALIQSIRNNVGLLQTTYDDLLRDNNATLGRMAESPDKVYDLSAIERQQKVKESLYLYLLERREENDLSKAFTAYNIRLLTPPMGDSMPISPSKKKIVFIAFFFAMAIPVGLIFVQLNLDNTIHTREDVEAVVKAPYLGAVPFQGKKPSAIKGALRRIIGKNPVEDNTSEIFVKPADGSPINEAFRIIRSNLSMMDCRIPRENGHGIITMMTSAIPGSGKTFVTLNIGAAFALKDKNVLIVDLDLRKGTLSKSLGTHSKGVSNCLLADVDPESVIVKNINGVTNLDLLPVGALPPNPAELLDSPTFANLLNKLSAKYDVVLLDCPPSESVTDAQIITQYANRTIYVVRAGNLHRDFLPLLQKYYEDKTYTNLAIVVNAVDNSSTSYGYGYGYGYGAKNNQQRPNC